MIRPPMPYFGSKRAAADEVWAHLGEPACYIEPFAGSLAVLLARPGTPGMEIIADADPFVTNFWRTVRHPEGWRDMMFMNVGPVQESEIEAWHRHLIAQRRTLQVSLDADLHYFDPRVAFMWWAGLSSWIGSGWCTGDDPARVPKQRPHVDGTLKGAHSESMIHDRVNELSHRMRKVVMIGGDWQRCVTDGIINRFRSRRGGVGVFLDPPYTHASGRVAGLYAADDALSDDVQRWALANACDAVRVVVAGYRDEYPGLVEARWAVQPWSTPSGYVNRSGNERRRADVLFMSPVEDEFGLTTADADGPSDGAERTGRGG